MGSLTVGLATNLTKPIKEIGHLSSAPGFSLDSFPLHSAVESCLLSCKTQEKTELLSGLLVKVKACGGVNAREENTALC